MKWVIFRDHLKLLSPEFICKNYSIDILEWDALKTPFNSFFKYDIINIE